MIKQKKNWARAGLAHAHHYLTSHAALVGIELSREQLPKVSVVGIFSRESFQAVTTLSQKEISVWLQHSGGISNQKRALQQGARF